MLLRYRVFRQIICTEVKMELLVPSGPTWPPSDIFMARLAFITLALTDLLPENTMTQEMEADENWREKRARRHKGILCSFLGVIKVV